MQQVFVIIVTFNGEKWIEKCLNCVAASTYPCKIIIVDNASADNTLSIIRKNFFDIQLFTNAENLGFGAANNIGIQEALSQGADYIFLLNQDVYVFPDTIEKVVDIAGKNVEFGIISPVQLNGSGEELDYFFKQYLLKHCSREQVEIIELRKSSVSLIPVRFVNAAAWLLSRECVKKVGLFHPVFFHYGEDNNYCARAQYYGFKAGVYTNAFVCHDRVVKTEKSESLLYKIKSVPRYSVLDIRKPFAIAYFQAIMKLAQLSKQAHSIKSKILKKALTEETKFLLNRKQISDIRKQMKTPFTMT
ncbi:MAG: glycosyltransferase family 2 protein [Chitinophagaceae bacterium]|nr:glycosyltransferase family 2 protein [Chitinophagaceae bacterium]